MMAILAMALLLLAWQGYLTRPTLLQQIRRNGELVVVTRVSPTTYYEAKSGPTGLEYDLTKLFADQLGVKLRVVVAPNIGDLFEALATGRADIAAAGLTVTAERKRRFRFSKPYMTVKEQLIYRSDHARPKDVDSLSNGSIEVLADSAQDNLLRRLKKTYPRLHWQRTTKRSGEDLLYRVWNREIDYTVADSDEMALDQSFYPELKVAFNLSGPENLAWALPRTGDNSLLRAVNGFFDRIEANGTLKRLKEKYYGHIKDFDYVGTKVFLRDVTQKLPKYRKYFVGAAKATGLDWRLLAAMSYQESHWDPKAVSPTGVRGLMMLTQDTAHHLGVDNRLNPEQSITGGAEYFKHVRQRIPDAIKEPIRTWLALAAYNIGYGHLEDARILTKKRGGNPDTWSDVKKNLPLLSQRHWYRQTAHGYARGWEPVRYVENIRSYYNLLKRITEPNMMQPPPSQAASGAPKAAPHDGGVNISTEAQSAF